ncbi:MAG: DNA translocase FtsK [bacterium]
MPRQLIYVLIVILIICVYFLKSSLFELIRNNTTILGFPDDDDDDYDDEYDDDYEDNDEEYEDYDNRHSKYYQDDDDDNYTYRRDEKEGDYYKTPKYNRSWNKNKNKNAITNNKSKNNRHSNYKESILKKYSSDYVRENVNVYDRVYNNMSSGESSSNGGSPNASENKENTSKPKPKACFFDMRTPEEKKQQERAEIKKKSYDMDLESTISNIIDNNLDILENNIGYAEEVEPLEQTSNIQIDDIRYTIRNNIKKKLEETLNLHSIRNIGDTKPYSLSRQIREYEEVLKRQQRVEPSLKKYSSKECMESFTGKKEEDGVDDDREVNNNNNNNNNKQGDNSQKQDYVNLNNTLNINLDIKSNIEDFFMNLLQDKKICEFLEKNQEKSFIQLEKLENFYDFKNNVNDNIYEIRNSDDDNYDDDEIEYNSNKKKNISGLINIESSNYVYPKVNLLKKNNEYFEDYDYIEIKKMTNIIINALKEYGINAKISSVNKNLIVTRYNLELVELVKDSDYRDFNKIINKIHEVINGLNISDNPILIKFDNNNELNNFFIDICNKTVKNIDLRELLITKNFTDDYSDTVFGLGKDMNNNSLIKDISELGHLLIAGNKSSGKSVLLNSIITSILYKSTPNEVKFFIIGTNQEKLKIFNNMPHLVSPIITNLEKGLLTINWCIAEMMMRFNLFSENNVTDLEEYNNLVIESGDSCNILQKIVVVIDELADLMTLASKGLEGELCRLAQLSKPTGIHLIIQTEVFSSRNITPLIKSSISCKICFSVSDENASKLILNETGAEKLLGYGDMLYKEDFSAGVVRVKGPYVTREEVMKVIKYININNGFDNGIGNNINRDVNSCKGVNNGVNTGTNSSIDGSINNNFNFNNKIANI